MAAFKIGRGVYFTTLRYWILVGRRFGYLGLGGLAGRLAAARGRVGEVNQSSDSSRKEGIGFPDPRTG